MRGTGTTGLLGAVAAAGVFAALVLAPSPAGEAGGVPAVERWTSAACGGASAPCARWEEVRRLSALLEDRTDLGEEDRFRLATAVVEEAAAARLDPLLVLAMIEVESGFDLDAVSGRGARGLMQLIPSTLQREVERSNLADHDPADPLLSVRAGVRYYRRLLDAFRQDHDLALMAYNAGPQRISRLRKEEGGVPDAFRAYPRRVQAEHRRLRAAAGLAPVAGAAPRTAMR